MPKAADMQAAAESIIDAAKAKKGNQQLQIAKAYVDPTSYCTFMVREDVLLHFEIDPVPDSIQDSDVVFVPRKKATASGTGTGKTPETVTKTGAGSISKSNNKLIGKAIKIPCGTGLTRTIKGVQKQIKFVTIRVPAYMSHSAICLWINTCFKQASKKPGYFFSEAGARIDISASFTDKAKLPNKKNE